MRAKEQERDSDIPALIQERDECRCAAGPSILVAGWEVPARVACAAVCLLPLPCPAAAANPARPSTPVRWPCARAQLHPPTTTTHILTPLTHPAPPTPTPTPTRSEICKAAYQKIQDLRAELDAQWAAYKEVGGRGRRRAAHKEVVGRALPLPPATLPSALRACFQRRSALAAPEDRPAFPARAIPHSPPSLCLLPFPCCRTTPSSACSCRRSASAGRKST